MSNQENWRKNIALFLSSQTISLLGSMLVQYAITWYITLTTQSGVMMTISIICGFVPTFLISPFAGVWADRYNRKLLIALSDSLIALATLVLAVLYLMGQGAVWMLFAASAVRALGSGIQMPAVGALLPQIVPQTELTKINGLSGSIQSVVSLVSPLLSGALMSVAPIETIFFIDVVTAAIAVGILVVFLRIPLHAKALTREKAGYFSDMAEGIRYIGGHGFLKTIFAYCAVFLVLVAPLAFLTPLQVARSFGDEVWRLTAIEIAFSVGMMLGGIAIASWGGLKNRTHTMIAAALLTAACTIVLGLVPVFWIYLAVMGITGLVMPFYNTPFTVMLQEKVEPDYMGRVFSVFTMISTSVMPLAMLVFGPIADYVRIEQLLLITGALMLLESLLMTRSRVLIEAGRTE